MSVSRNGSIVYDIGFKQFFVYVNGSESISVVDMAEEWLD